MTFTEEQHGSLDVRTNPALCRHYAELHTQQHAKECLAYWRILKKDARHGGEWRNHCVEMVEKWEAILEEQRSGLARKAVEA